MDNSNFTPFGKGGWKDIGDKTVWHLLDFNIIDQMMKVVNYGAEKYSPDNWKLVPGKYYFDAMIRHALRIMAGERLDPESNLPHEDHMLADAYFFSWHVKNKTIDEV